MSHLPAATRRLIRSLKPYDIVVVTWEDAYTYISDTTIEVAAEQAGNSAYIRKTLGFVVRADDEYIVIGSTDDRKAPHTSAEIADITVLCAGFVRDVRLLERDRK